MPAGNKAVVLRFYQEVVNEGRLDLLEELLDPGYIEHTNPSGSGIDGFKRFFLGLGEAFPDLRITVEDLIEEGGRVAARVTVRATHQGTLMGSIAPTGRAVEFAGIDIFELAGGRIIGRWNHRDLLGLMGRLGAFALPARGDSPVPSPEQGELETAVRRSGERPPLR